MNHLNCTCPACHPELWAAGVKGVVTRQPGKPPSWISRRFTEDEIRQIIREEIRSAQTVPGESIAGDKLNK